MQKDTLQELRDLLATFNLQSRATIEKLDKAIQLAHSAEQSKQPKPLDAKTAQILKDLGFRSKKAAPKAVTFVLVDGSGSMAQREWGGAQSPLEVFFKGATAVLVSMPKEPVAFGFWGETTGIQRIKFPGFSPAPHSGSDLAPAIDDLEIIARHIPSTTKLRVILVSDGDIFDREKSAEKLKTLLTAHPNVTLRGMFICSLAPMNSQVGRLLEDLMPYTKQGLFYWPQNSGLVAEQLRREISQNKQSAPTLRPYFYP